MKRKIKKFLKKIKNIFSKKTVVNVPVLYGELLVGRTAIITGGSSGIGFAIAEAFLRNGASVIIVGRDKGKLDSACQKLEKSLHEGNFVKSYVVDIGKVASIKKELDKITKENKIDILVNNAGVSVGESVENTSEKDFDSVMGINLKGTYFISQYFLNYFKNNSIKANILNVLSSSSNRPATTPYTLSKWSLKGFTIGLAKKAINDGIVVNGIAPGPTATPMLGKDESDINLVSSPAGRYSTPKEIANLSTVLVSDLGKMVVGDIIYATGGAGVITVDDIEY